MLNDGKPNINFTMSFGKGLGSNQDFSANIKKAKAVFYIMIPIFCLISLFTMVMGTTTRKVSCTYKRDSAVYNCQVTSKNFLTGTSVKNYTNIQKAVLASSRSRSSKGGSSTVYQVQFLNSEGEKLGYDNSWTSLSSSVKVKVINLNTHFNAKKDFSYDLGMDWVLILFSLPFLIFPLLIFFVFRHLINNYIFEEVSLGQYQAVMKVKDIGKMNLNRQQMDEFLYQIKNQNQSAGGTSSWLDKDREFIEQDVEDATKEFYDDGK